MNNLVSNVLSNNDQSPRGQASNNGAPLGDLTERIIDSGKKLSPEGEQQKNSQQQGPSPDEIDDILANALAQAEAEKQATTPAKKDGEPSVEDVKQLINGRVNPGSDGNVRRRQPRKDAASANLVATNPDSPENRQVEQRVQKAPNPAAVRAAAGRNGGRSLQGSGRRRLQGRGARARRLNAGQSSSLDAQAELETAKRERQALRAERRRRKRERNAARQGLI